MTTTRERFVIATRRKNKRGEYVLIHIFRPARDFKRTLAGTNPTTPAYVRSLMQAQDEYARFCEMGRPKATGQRNAKGSLIDDNGMAITTPPAGTAPVEEHSVAWLVRQFMASAQVKALKPTTRGRFDNALQRVCALPWPKAGPGAVVGGAAFSSMRKEHMLKIRAHFTTTPAQADTVVKAVRAMYYWGEEMGFITTVNPAARMGQLWQSDGIEPLTYDDHAKVCACYPVGTRERLAYDLALYSGARCVDLHMLGPQHLRRGWLHWTEEKGKDSKALKRRARKNKVREWQAHAELLASITATPHGIRHFIVRGDGQPYKSAPRLSEAIRKWLKKAGVTKSAHGIRKLGATMLADNGADLITIRDFLGHASFQEAEIYIRNRDKRRGSMRAIKLMDIDRAARGEVA
jgi:integrase